MSKNQVNEETREQTQDALNQKVDRLYRESVEPALNSTDGNPESDHEEPHDMWWDKHHPNPDEPSWTLDSEAKGESDEDFEAGMADWEREYGKELNESDMQDMFCQNLYTRLDYNAYDMVPANVNSEAFKQHAEKLQEDLLDLQTAAKDGLIQKHLPVVGYVDLSNRNLTPDSPSVSGKERFAHLLDLTADRMYRMQLMTHPYETYADFDRDLIRTDLEIFAKTGEGMQIPTYDTWKDRYDTYIQDVVNNPKKLDFDQILQMRLDTNTLISSADIGLINQKIEAEMTELDTKLEQELAMSDAMGVTGWKKDDFLLETTLSYEEKRDAMYSRIFSVENFGSAHEMPESVTGGKPIVPIQPKLRNLLGDDYEAYSKRAHEEWTLEQMETHLPKSLVEQVSFAGHGSNGGQVMHIDFTKDAEESAESLAQRKKDNQKNPFVHPASGMHNTVGNDGWSYDEPFDEDDYKKSDSEDSKSTEKKITSQMEELLQKSEANATKSTKPSFAGDE